MSFLELINRLQRHLSYYSKAKGARFLHSDAVFRLYQAIHSNETLSSSIPLEYRKQLYQLTGKIRKTDFGSGESKERSIREIVHSSSISNRNGRLLAQIISFLAPKNSLELGTCFGMSSAWMSSATNTRIHSVEGCPETHAIATEMMLRYLKDQDIELVLSDFNSFLASNEESYDFIFLDGNHQKEPTIRYTQQLWERLNQGGMLVLDDIRWSDGMWNAWQQIQSDARFPCTIDLQQFGLVWKIDKAKEHFILKNR